MACTAHLLIYSGRQSPSKRLTADESRSVLAAVAEVVQRGAPADATPPQLGGVIVEWDDGDNLSLYRAAIARNGVVTIYKRSGGPPESRSDVSGVEASVRYVMRDAVATDACVGGLK